MKELSLTEKMCIRDRYKTEQIELKKICMAGNDCHAGFLFLVQKVYNIQICT